MMDLIRISTTDPAWVTWSLVLTRLVGIVILIWWITSMIRTNQGSPVWRRHYLAWPWSLTGWMTAVAILLVSGVVRILIIGHIREQDAIGVAFRAIEIAAAMNFAVWSVSTYWRWRHPEAVIVQEGVFGTLAQALPIIVSNHEGTIQHTTAGFDELVGALPGELIGKSLDVIMPERYIAGHHHGMQRYIETREPHIMGTVVVIDMLRRDGVEIPVYLALNTADVDGKPWFVASIWARFGDPGVGNETTNVRQDVREGEQNRREVFQDERTAGQDRLTGDQDERTAGQDQRDVTADARDVTADARDVRADAADVRADSAETDRHGEP